MTGSLLGPRQGSPHVGCKLSGRPVGQDHPHHDSPLGLVEAQSRQVDPSEQSGDAFEALDRRAGAKQAGHQDGFGQGRRGLACVVFHAFDIEAEYDARHANCEAGDLRVVPDFERGGNRFALRGADR